MNREDDFPLRRTGRERDPVNGFYQGGIIRTAGFKNGCLTVLKILNKADGGLKNECYGNN